MDLLAQLPRLLPRAIAWGETIAADVARRGALLADTALSDARTVGVRQPEIIRVLMVDSLSLPTDPELQVAAVQTGLLGPDMVGLTLGYAILICHGDMSRRLLSHECRHVAQYEEAGSISLFLPIYLDSIVRFGYVDSPFEQDARANELPDA